jgi:ABC-type Zn2+ transport system substrate-binding protein/surface adhesin
MSCREEAHDHDHNSGGHDHNGHDHEHDHDHEHKEGEAHDHGKEEAAHDHSNLSLADAAKEIVALQTAIAEAFAANDPDKAHDPLHEIGHIILVLEDAGKKASLSEADTTELKATKDALMVQQRIIKMWDSYTNMINRELK